ncbi:hypothetical protein [Myxococcus vastator]|uniref:hypothetical protein n=1 Tax=Myxococcus vastator TaxID=2709664 RepID=UPI0013D354BC|nr:hypothetical protein [Myxococcus vastator]
MEPKTSGKQVRVIPIDDARATQVFEIGTHPTIPAVIEFPEAFSGTPSCGDCIDLGAPLTPSQLAESEALFGFQAFPDANYLVIKPAGPSAEEGGIVPQRSYLTSVNVRLKSKLTLTLIIRYAPAEQVDARVMFTLPNRANETAYVRDQVAKAKRELEADFADRIQEGMSRALMKAFAEPHECVRLDARKWHDQAFIEAKELCRFGTRRFLTFTVENRGRGILHFGEAVIRKGSGNNAQPVPDVLFYPDPQELPFQQRVTAVVAFNVDADDSASTYELTFRELGGKGRQMTLADLAF